MNSIELRRFRWGVIVLALCAFVFAAIGVAQAVLPEGYSPQSIGGDSEPHYNVAYYITQSPSQVIYTKVKVGDSIKKTMPDNPMREGFIFTGWYTAPIGGTLVTENTVPHGDTVYYSGWLPMHPRQHTIQLILKMETLR